MSRCFLPALLIVALLTSGCASSHIGQPAAPPPTPIEASFELIRDVVVSPPDWPAELMADIYRPRLEGELPGVLLIHGGAWKRGSRDQVEKHAKALAARGYVVVNTSYRFVPEHIWPTQLRDVQQAARWMREQGGAYGIDPERIGSFGYSAGGHLASLLAAVAEDPQWGEPNTSMRAVVAGGNPADLALYEGGSLVPAFLGGSRDEIPQTFRDASPISHISAAHPPVFIYQASLDRLVPLEQAERYKAALDAAGITNELFIIRGHGHISGFFADGAAIEAALNFLDRYLRVGPGHEDQLGMAR